jgi:toxin CcdB
MARFDVYRNPEGRGYLLDVQAGLLRHLNTRVVVPLLPLDHAPSPARRLNPIFRIGDDDVVMVTQFIASVPVSLLKFGTGSLAVRGAEIVDALDMLLVGF